MAGWDSYRAVYGAELRAAAHDLTEHGWPVVEVAEDTVVLLTGAVLDVLEVPAAVGRGMCAALRTAGHVVPVAATPTGTWWFPIAAGANLPDALHGADGVCRHSDGAAVLAPPSQVPDGWVHWRVNPARSGFRVPPAEPVLAAAVAAVEALAQRRVPVGSSRA